MNLQFLVPPDDPLVLLVLLLFLDLLLLPVPGTPLLVADGALAGEAGHDSLSPWSSCLALGLHVCLQVLGENLQLDVGAIGHVA